MLCAPWFQPVIVPERSLVRTASSEERMIAARRRFSS